MSLTSTLKAAEDALLAQIIAQQQTPGSPLASGPISGGVPIRLGDPGVNAQLEHVWIAEVAEASQTWELTGSGAYTRRENFELGVRILIRQAGDDYATIRDRAAALSGEIEKAIVADVTLAGAVFEAWIARIQRETAADQESRFVLVSVTVGAQSYLS